jgi:hypothetical protein
LIGVISPRSSSFKNPLEYLELGRDGKQRGRAAWMEFHNLATRNSKLAACFMAATAAGSVSGTETPVYHFSVSFDIDDPVDEWTMRRVAERTRRDMGLLEYQCVVVAHQDRSHPHLHFLVNLVHPERGTLWRDWRDYYRLERTLRAQEVELGLRVVPGWNAPVPLLARGGNGLENEPQNERWMKPRLGPRRGDDAFLRDMIVRAAPVLQRARSWAEIERGLAEEGLTLRSKGGGFIITDGKRRVKASEVGRACSRYHLEKRLGRWPDYRARLAAASMARIEPAVQPEPVACQPESPVPAVDFLTATSRQETPAPSIQAITPYLTKDPQLRARTNHRPQLGDAGHGIVELFGHTLANQEVQAASDSDHASIELAGRIEPATAVPIEPVEPRVPVAPTRPRRRVDFLKDVKDRAAPVLQRAESWDELERDLAERGLSLRVSGGGFTITDEEMAVKASEVGRAFSRLHLEKRLGNWSDYRARAEVATIPRTEPAMQAAPSALQPEVRAVDPAASTPPLPAPTQTVPTTTAPAPTHELRELQAEATQPRARGHRRPQFGDAGYGIADLFGHAPAKQETQEAPVLDHTAPEQQPRSVEVQADQVFTALAAEVDPTAHRAAREQHAPTIEPTRAAGSGGSGKPVQPEPIAPAATTAPAEPITHAVSQALPLAPSHARRRVDFVQAVKDRATPVLQRAESWDEVERGLAERGLSLRVESAGFTITDGEMEVEVSEVGRAFSRVYLEKRLGLYRAPGADVAAPEVSPVAPPPTVQPHVLEEAHAPISPTQPSVPELSEQPPAPPEVPAAKPPKPERFTIFEAYGTFGVEDRVSGEIYFMESQDRADDEVRLANEVAERHPHSISVAHLRALDDAWHDARGLPRWSDLEDHEAVGHNVSDGVPGLIDASSGSASDWSMGRPEGDAVPPPAEAVEPIRPVWPPQQPVVPREPTAPIRKKVRPPTRREEYETALVNFAGELKALYIDAHRARRAFAEDACVYGREHAMRTLAETPKQYGRLSFLAKRERLPEAVRWGAVYAGWQEERTRPATRRAAALYRQATQTEAADRVLRDAEQAADQKADEVASIEKRSERADDAPSTIQEGAREIFADSHRAIQAIIKHRKTHALATRGRGLSEAVPGLDEVVRALQHSPEECGDLRAEEQEQFFGIVRKLDTSAARLRVNSFADKVRAAYEALADRPKVGELERANKAEGEARSAVVAARRARSKLPKTSPSDCVAEAGVVLRCTARGSVARAEHMVDQLARMLPTEAVTLACKALSLARGPEHYQRRERRGRDTGSFGL